MVRLVAGALCAASFIIAHPAMAAHPVPASEIATLHEWASLTGTSPGSGVVDLQANVRSGDTRGSISVAVRDYPAGGYTVSAITVSSTSTVVLGAVNVKKGFGLRRITTGAANFGGKQNPFPTGFSPFDVALVSITDSNGNVVSSGTLTPVQNGYFNAIAPLISSTSHATGYALIRADGPPPAASVPVVLDSGDDGAGSITVAAGGTGVLSGLNIYTGGTVIVTGSLSLSGSSVIILGPPIYIVNGGTLTVAGTAVTTGTLALSGSSPTVTSGSLTINSGGDYGGGVIEVGGGTLTLNTGSDGGLTVLSGSSSISGGAFTLPSYVGTTLTIDGSDINGGTLTLSGSIPPITNGLLTLSGTCPPIVSGSLTFPSGGSLTLSSSNLNGVTVVISGSLTLATGTPVLDGSSVYLSGTVVNPAAVDTSTMLRAKSDTPVPSTNTTDTVDAPSTTSPATGELVIHAQGLPPSASVTYFADATEIGTATTDKSGNLVIRAVQGGENGTLPDTVDLYSVQTVTVEDSLGNVLLTAGF
jgi:hypothetical protein